MCGTSIPGSNTCVEIRVKQAHQCERYSEWIQLHLRIKTDMEGVYHQLTEAIISTVIGETVTLNAEMK